MTLREVIDMLDPGEVLEITREGDTVHLVGKVPVVGGVRTDVRSVSLAEVDETVVDLIGGNVAAALEGARDQAKAGG